MARKHNSWEQVLRGNVVPDPKNEEEMLAFLLRKAMLRRELEEKMAASNYSEKSFNALIAKIEEIKNGLPQ